MNTFKSSGKMSVVALVLMAGAFLAPQSASADTREIRAKFAYSKSAPAEAIYSDFRHRAAYVCREVDRRPISLRLAEKRCAEDMLNKAVTKLGRADVAALHNVQLAQIASR